VRHFLGIEISTGQGLAVFAVDSALSTRLLKISCDEGFLFFLPVTFRGIGHHSEYA
jgi:hypothetical protein